MIHLLFVVSNTYVDFFHFRISTTMEDHVGIQGVVVLPRALYRKKKYSVFQSILAEHSSIFHGLSNGTCPGNKLPRVTKIWTIIIIMRVWIDALFVFGI